MVGIRRVGESKPRLATAVLAVVVTVSALALSVSVASASSPTSGEYHLDTSGAQAPGGPRSSGDVGSSHSSSALPILLAGFVAVGAGGVAFVYFRRRRSEAPS